MLSILAASSAVAFITGRSPALISPRASPVCSLKQPVGYSAAGLALASALALAGANGCFGILDQTEDELADILGVDEVSPALTSAVLAGRPIYEVFKTVSPSCTDAVFPEFNAVNDFNDCLLLKSRVFWRGVNPPLVIDQTMQMSTIAKQSTGSSVWGGGVVLARYMEELGGEFWRGKQVIELGSGAGLGSITAAKLGAQSVLATDRDADVLELIKANVAKNLGAKQKSVSVARLDWGQASDVVDRTQWDVAIGADLTYNRDGWPFLFRQLQQLRVPAILSASERRTDELKSLRAALDDAGLTYTMVDSPFEVGYASTNIKLFRIDPYDGPVVAALPPPDESPAVAQTAKVLTPAERAQMVAKARANEEANAAALAKIAGGAIIKADAKCDVEEAMAGRCQP